MLHLLTRFTRETFIFTKELNTHIHWDGTKKENEFGLFRYLVINQYNKMLNHLVHCQRQIERHKKHSQQKDRNVDTHPMTKLAVVEQDDCASKY